eukprot:gb/GECH01013230.1/.p1 GENE.gb/GECH01013230.1/~~gb/GECH01013230.1/.p1  ORF type:complete len:321 (+),score=61.38 gb/GECH01013230.1/:1-963(+)
MSKFIPEAFNDIPEYINRYYKFIQGQNPSKETGLGNDEGRQAISAPEKFDSWKRKADIFVKERDMFDGISVTSQTLGGFGEDFAAIIVQGISVGSQVQPPDYNIGVQFNSPLAIAFTRVDTNQVIFATSRVQISPNSSVEVAYNNANSKWMADFNYQGSTYVGSAKLKQSKWTFGYLKRLSPHLELGSGVAYDMENRKSKFQVVGSYDAKYNNLGWQFKLSDNGNRNERIGKLYYGQTVADSTDAGLEASYNYDKSEFNYKIGLTSTLFKSKYSFTIDPTFTLLSQFDFQPASFLSASLSLFSKPSESVRFGLSMNVIPQ